MNIMPFPVAIITYINSNSLVKIKGGTERASFLDIWMVSVGDRLFARSWGMSNKSWSTEFIKTGLGQLKFGEIVIDVKGKQINDKPLNILIDNAYKNKYNQNENKRYVEEITEPKYIDFTMEFFTYN